MMAAFFNFVQYQQRILLVACILLYVNANAQEVRTADNNTGGYEIKFLITPNVHQVFYLSTYFGDYRMVIDSAVMDENTHMAVFKGNQKLPEGLYVVANKNGSGIFDLLVDSNQYFSADLKLFNGQAPRLSFTNSPQNSLLVFYDEYLKQKFSELTIARNQLKYAIDSNQLLNAQRALNRIDGEIKRFRKELIEKYPQSFLTQMLEAMYEPVLPEALKIQKNRSDSTAARQYISDHFWDGVEFWDSRLVRTPFFTTKLKKYFKEVVAFNTDTVISKIDWMLSYALPSAEVTQVMLDNFINASQSHVYKWNDSVFIHLFEKFINSKTYSWLQADRRKLISEKAYYLMGKMIGSPAPNIELPDREGHPTSLYDLDAKVTILAFWDPTCSHCRETLPRLDSMYQAKWKNAGLRVFSFASESDGTRADFLNYINDKKLQDWTSVYNSISSDQQRLKSGKKTYTQLYDVWFFPSFFVLDKEKRFIAKKLNYQQMVDFLAAYIK